MQTSAWDVQVNIDSLGWLPCGLRLPSRVRGVYEVGLRGSGRHPRLARLRLSD